MPLSRRPTISETAKFCTTFDVWRSFCTQKFGGTPRHTFVVRCVNGFHIIPAAPLGIGVPHPHSSQTNSPFFLENLSSVTAPFLPQEGQCLGCSKFICRATILALDLFAKLCSIQLDPKIFNWQESTTSQAVCGLLTLYLYPLISCSQVVNIQFDFAHLSRKQHRHCR